MQLAGIEHSKVPDTHDDGGTVPNVGIGYSLGEQRYTYGNAMSGMDGSLYLEDIIIE